MKLSKIILIVLIFQGVIFQKVLFSQHITNTLGITGLFRIKDNSTTYFTLTQSNGYVELTKSLKMASTTDLNTGVIYKGTTRFIHDYKNASNLGNNIFIGLNSGNFTLGGVSFAEGSINCGFGSNTLSALTTGSNNVALGHNCQLATTSGQQNTAIGSFSLQTNTTGSFNVCVGGQTMFDNISGIGNTAVGYHSLADNITGNGNVAVGSSSLELNTSGNDNTSIGNNSLGHNVTGFRNTAVGTGALSVSLNAYNTALGYDAGSTVTTGTNLTLIGQDSEPSSPNTSNQITLGNNSVTSLRCNVQSITSLSDIRDKKNVNELSLGLNFIMKLKPREFNWDKREWYDNNLPDGSKMESDPTAGFIAQELDSAQNEFNAEWLKLVLKDNPEKWEATYGNLLPVVVKAIQELKSENDKLKEENSKLADEISRLSTIEERLAKLEVKIMKQDILKEVKSAEK